MRVPEHLASLVAIAVALATGCHTVKKHPTTDELYAVKDGFSEEQLRFTDVLSHYGMGVIHETHDELDQAIDQYLKAAELDPDNEALHFRIVRRLVRLKRNDEAILLMQRLTERHPKSTQAKAWLAITYQASDQSDKAKEVYHTLTDQNEKDYIPYLELASIYLRENDREKAEEVLIKGTKFAEQRLELFKILGQYYTKGLSLANDSDVNKEQVQKAIQVFEKASNLGPEDMAILSNLGSLYLLQGDLERAISRFQKIEKLHEGNLQIKQSIALQIVQSLGDLNKAIFALTSYVADHPDNANVHYYLGELHQQADDKEQATASLTAAAELSGDDPVPYLRLSLLTMDNEPAASIRALEQGLEKMPDELRLSEMLAYAHLANKATDEALTWFKKVDAAKSEEDQTGSFHFNYALAEYRAGNHTAAASHLIEAMNYNLAYLDRFVGQMLADEDTDLKVPIAVLRQVSMRYDDEPTVYRFLAFLYSYDQQFQESVKACETAIEAAEERVGYEFILDTQFYFTYGAALEQTGEYETASQTFLKIIELNPDHPNAHNYLAYMWAERGERLPEALEHIQAALEIEPESAAFIDTLGWIYFRQGKFNKALKQIKRAAEKLPEDPTIVDHLGDVYEKLGDMDQALEHWRQAFIMNAENEDVRKKLESRDVAIEPLLEKSVIWKKNEEAAKKKSTETENTTLEPDPVESAGTQGVTNENNRSKLLEPEALRGRPVTEPHVTPDTSNDKAGEVDTERPIVVPDKIKMHIDHAQ